MKDITIKAANIKRELWTFLGVFIFSFGLNIYAIIHYKTNWSELYSHLHIVVLMSIFFFFIISVLRLLVVRLTKLFHKKTTS